MTNMYSFRGGLVYFFKATSNVCLMHLLTKQVGLPEIVGKQMANHQQLITVEIN